LVYVEKERAPPQTLARVVPWTTQSDFLVAVGSSFNPVSNLFGRK
jgi:hypothetical protein